ncbi:MAG: Ig-like domain-containing protein [Erysipelotrichaceae bacterium]
MIFTSLFSNGIPFVKASSNYTVVDDNVTDASLKNYFTFSSASDPNGETGWAYTAVKDSTIDSVHPSEAKSEHWVWNENNAEAKKHTYTFTFEGTGVEILGVKNDDKYNFQLDQNPVEEVTITGASKTITTLYSKQGLTNGKHVVSVSLPSGNYTGLQVSYAKVFNNVRELEETTIPHTKTNGSNNKFTFSNSGWSAMGSNDEHVWSDNGASSTWYEVAFVGEKIDIYAGKNKPMGKVKYTIDGKDYGTYSLYNNGNINSTLIKTIDGLSNGAHVLRAEATDSKDAAASDKLIDCAKVVVYHEPYTVSDMNLSQTSLDLSEDSTYQIVANATPDYAVLKGMKYTSSNEGVASVDSKGLISANAEGNATISVKAANLDTTRTMDVKVVKSIKQMHGTIGDTDIQYTQNKYDTIKTMGAQSKTLSAWINDKAVSEIALLSKNCKLKNVSVRASDFKDGEKVLAKENIKTNFIKSVKAYNGDYLGYGSTTREVPAETSSNRSESSDVIYQSTPITIGYNKVQPVWVEINVPKGTAAGNYTGKISVDADGLNQPMEFTYTVNVKDANLPDAADFKDGFDLELWQYPYASAEYYNVEPFSEKHLEILRPIMEKYKSVGGHAVTATIVEEAWSGQTYSKNVVHYPSMVKWTKQSNGSFTYDYTNFDKWISLNKEIGISDKIVLYSIAPWNDSIGYWENGTLKYESNSAGSARYKVIWDNFLQDLINHLMEKGWFDNAYIGIDERGFSNAAFDQIQSVKNIHGKSLKTAGAMDSIVSHRDMAMRVDDLNIGDTSASAHPSEFASLLKARNEKGLRTTLYSCTEHEPGNFSLSNPVESYWGPMFAGKKGTTGFLRWAFDAWVENPLEDTTHNAFEPGDCFLVFPDVKTATNPKVFSSVRLEKMAEGVRDMNKILKMVKEIPSLQSDVDAMYEKINMTVGTKRDYLDAAKTQIVINDVKTFKADLDALSDKYIALKNSGVEHVDSVVIDEGSSLSIPKGTTKQLHATVLPSNTLNGNVTWKSSDDSVATITQSGMLSGLKQGTCRISATSLVDPTKIGVIDVTISKSVIDPASQVAYYSFDEWDGDVLKDSWGTRNGTNHGATLSEGMSKQALNLNEPNKNVTLDGSATLGNTWTVSYWAYNTNTKEERVSLLMDKNKNYSFDARLAGSDRPKAGVHVGKNAGDVLSFNYVFPTNKWVNITWTFDKAKGLSMYADGKLTQLNDWVKNHNFTCPIDIIGGTNYTGKIDELKVYNKVLSESDIATNMEVEGLNIEETNKSLFVNDTYKIITNLISNVDDKTITYVSSNPEVATVSSDGTITALKRGETFITVENAAGGFSGKVKITVSKHLIIKNTLTEYELDAKHLSDIERAPGTDRQYLGQPDMVKLKDGTLITAYPIGHGKGPLVMQISKDNGETWKEKKDIPASWAKSQETPTMYVLNLADGTERIMMITACPGWDNGSIKTHGWNTSYSDDGGKTWTEYKHWYENLADGKVNRAIVGMASLIQLKDEKGNYKQEWMGVYHNDSPFTNYKTILSFDENGNEQWSEPEAYLSQYRDMERAYQMCEVGMFRSPDGKRILGLIRSQSHNNPATLIYSDDEGKTWSKPMDLPGSLAGERHKAVYDPITGRLLITFREIQYDKNNNNEFNGGSDWRAGEWVAWIGTYEDLLEQNDGQYRIQLAKDYAQNTYSGDTGYAGVTVSEDGTFVMNSYGHWDEEFSKAWNLGVTTDLCYIKQAKFKLAEIDNMAGLLDRKAITAAIQEGAKVIKNSEYTTDSWNLFEDAYQKAMKIQADSASNQKEIDAATSALLKAMKGLALLDRTSVKQNLLEASKLVEKDYTDASWKVFMQVKAELEKLMKQTSLNQKDLDEGNQKFEQAMKALKKVSIKPDEPSVDEPSVDKPSVDKPSVDKPSTNVPQAPVVGKPSTDAPQQPVENDGTVDEVLKPETKPENKPNKDETLQEEETPLSKGDKTDYTGIAAGVGIVGMLGCLVLFLKRKKQTN